MSGTATHDLVADIRKALTTGYAVSISDPRPSRSEAIESLDTLAARLERVEAALRESEQDLYLVRLELDEDQVERVASTLRGMMKREPHLIDSDPFAAAALSDVTSPPRMLKATGDERLEVVNSGAEDWIGDSPGGDPAGGAAGAVDE
jgi:hypothetical protein